MTTSHKLLSPASPQLSPVCDLDHSAKFVMLMPLALSLPLSAVKKQRCQHSLECTRTDYFGKTDYRCRLPSWRWCKVFWFFEKNKPLDNTTIQYKPVTIEGNNILNFWAVIYLYSVWVSSCMHLVYKLICQMCYYHVSPVGCTKAPYLCSTPA